MTSTAGSPDGRIGLVILGGFLGAGKTTWLRHQIHEGRFAGARLLINEAAETSVDHVLFDQGHPIEKLPGGCACCEGLPALLAALRRLADARIDGGGPDRIVLETSGLADPGAILSALRSDPVLVHHVRVSDIVVLVDGRLGARPLVEDPLVCRQIESADRIVVTKVAEAAPETLSTLLATLSALNPDAALQGADFGSDVALPDWSGSRPIDVAGGGARATAPIRTARIRLDEDIDWTVFAVWMSALLEARGEDILRIKGVVRTPTGRILVQGVRKTVQRPERLPPAQVDEGADDDVIVVIGRGYEPADLERSIRAFAGLDP